MQVLEWKTRVAILWLLQTVNYVSYVLIGLVDAEPFAAGVEPGAGIVIAFFFFVPCLMAWISIVTPSASRWPNVVLGALFGLLKLAAALGLIVELTPAIFVNELWAFAAAGLIVWHAWKLPAVIEPSA